MIDLADLLDLVGGRVPLLIEIKSEWEAPDARYLQAIADTVADYRGPVALMSFDPAVMAGIRQLAPHIPVASCRACSPATAGGAASSAPSAPTA